MLCLCILLYLMGAIAIWTVECLIAEEISFGFFSICLFIWWWVLPFDVVLAVQIIERKRKGGV